MELRNREIIGRFVFKLTEDKHMYECRGEVMYDDEHDQMPEPALWRAAEILAEQLNKVTDGKWEKSHSEKGWVEV